MTNTPAALDFGVSDRHAIGASYARPAQLENAVALYRDGLLRLPPHPDWKGDFTDWTADPFKDRNWQFQHHTLRWVNPLRWAALEGDEAARDEWVRVARSWFDANVPAEQAAGLFAWKDMADGNRAVQFALGAPLVPEGSAWFVELLEAHRDWLMDDSHIIKGNHGLHQNIGLLVVGAVLRDRAAMEKARTRLIRSFNRAFDEQGCNEEGSTGYHQMNIRWWRQAWHRVATEGLRVPVHVSARLDAACLALAHLAQPDGELPQVGDAKRTKLAVGLSDFTDFVASAGARGTQPSSTALVLNGGYAIARSGWGESKPARDESHTLIRHGAFASAHGHHDSGSLHIYTAGRRWLTDPGFHSYQTNDPTRAYLASREAHNVPLLSDRQRDASAAFDLDRSESTDAFDDYLLIDRGYDGARLERRVTYLRAPDCWIVWDRARAEEPVTLEQHWQTDVGLVTRYRDRGFRLHDSRSSLTMTWLAGESHRRRHDAVDGELTGWIGTKWKTLQPATRITASAAGTEPQLVTLIGAHSPAALGLVDSHATRSGHLAVTLVRGTRGWHVALNAEGVSVRER